MSFVISFLQTQVCIQQTTLDLLKRGYDVHVVADACSSRSQVDRMFALEVSKTVSYVLLHRKQCICIWCNQAFIIYGANTKTRFFYTVVTFALTLLG